MIVHLGDFLVGIGAVLALIGLRSAFFALDRWHTRRSWRRKRVERCRVKV